MSSIFLSHNRKDKPFVRKLSERLQAHGIRTWVDEAEMRLGDSLLSKIETAIREFKYLGVVLSPNSVASEWVRREVNMALNEEIHGNKVKVLPLLYQKCEIPGFLKDKVYADFTEDFEEGFEVLLAHLQSDLHQEAYKQRRVYEMLRQAYQDWLSFGRQDAQLLSKDKITLILQHLTQPKPSLDLMVYLLCSISHLGPANELDLAPLKSLLERRDTPHVVELFDHLLKNKNPKIRLGAITLVERLAEPNAGEVVLGRLKDEDDRYVRRAGLRCVSRLGKRLTNELAQFLLESDEDWLIQSYSLQSLNQQKSCLLFSDETEFATELGQLAQAAGFKVITTTDPFSYREIDESGSEILRIYELIILVRGEHYTQEGHEIFYNSLRGYVSAGGTLFATPWVNFETAYHDEFARVLPFKPAHNRFYLPTKAHPLPQTLLQKQEFLLKRSQRLKENIPVIGQAASNELAQKLFPKPVSYQSSLELLEAKEGTVVLLETEQHLPLFGFRHFGDGVCYYFNTCQHTCFGEMKSPLQSSPELYRGLQIVFEQIYKTSMVPTEPGPSALPGPPATIAERQAGVKTTQSSRAKNLNEDDSLKQQIINLTRRLQKLREIQALKGIDMQPHYLIEIEDIEEKLAELQKQRSD